MPNVLVLTFKGVEDIELATTVDLLRRAAVNVTTASLNDEELVTTSQKGVIKPDALFKAVEAKDYDAVVVPGGPGSFDIVNNARLGTVLKRHHAAGKLVAAICAAPLVLATQGIDAGGDITSYPGVDDKIKALGYNYKTDRVVVSAKNVVTSRGPGTAIDFGLKLVELIVDRKTAEKIANDILVPLP